MASTINATTSSGIVATADNTGNLALQSAGTTIMTVTSTGVTTQVGAPAFSAYRSGTGQSISSNAWVKAQLNSEDFDTNNNFDNITNYRFTPTVAGYYLIAGSIAVDSSSSFGNGIFSAIYKNGTLYRQASGYNTAGGNTLTSIPNVSAVIYFNGSTDYVELYGYSVGGVGMLFAANLSTFLSGAFVRSA